MYACARHGIYGSTTYCKNATPSERCAIRVNPGWLWTTVDVRTFNRALENDMKKEGHEVDDPWQWRPSFKAAEIHFFIRPVKIEHNEDIYIESYVPTEANRTF